MREIFASFFSAFCFLFVRPFISLIFIKKIEGKENIPKKNFILAANHQSHLDQLFTGYLCTPRRFTYIGQTDRYQGLEKFLLKLLYLLWGVIPVNRKDKISRKKALERCIFALKQGFILIIYPEGTRTRTGKLQKGKCGIGKIFLATKKPILPVGIKGAFELLPPGGKLKIKKNIEIKIGKPLFFEKNSSPEEITKKVIEEIANLLGQKSPYKEKELCEK